MKIYLISQKVNNGYDTYDSAIVCAKNKEEAIKWHPKGNYDYPEGDKNPFNKDPNRFLKSDSDYGTWAKKKYVRVACIGKADKKIKKGVICASFNAG